MNKAEFVDAVTNRRADDGSRTTKKEIEAVLNAMMDVIQDTVSGGDKVVLVGFGTFEPKHRKARAGRNPSSGIPIDIPETYVPAFSASAAFKERTKELAKAS